MKNDINLKYLDKGDSKVCEKILRALPNWFGIEEAICEYVTHCQVMPMIIAYEGENPIAFVSLKNHSPYTSEIYVMGIINEYQRLGLGSLLLMECEKVLKRAKIEFLQVKTLSPERECEFYNKTRLFYQSYGFKEVETFPNLWGKENPCLLLIKNI